jgi:tRNA A-37 threonylcarbamoyl transferase component Bud32
VKYKPGTSCLVGYELIVEGRPVAAHATAYPSGAEELGRGRTRAGVYGPLGPGLIVLEEANALVSVFPNDARVTALPEVADPARRAVLLREIVPDRTDLWPGPLRVLTYRAERRQVAQVLAGGEPRLALKAYTADGYASAQGSVGRFEPRGALRVPRLLGRGDRRHVLAFEWLPGRSLGELLPDPALSVGGVERVGAALAELHAQDPGPRPPVTRLASAAALMVEATVLATLCPPLARRAGDLVRRVVARILVEPPAYGATHADFHPGRVALDGDGVAMLDLDLVERGDPAADLAGFVAHLERDVIRGTLAPARLALLRDALLEGYRRATREAIPRHVELLTAAAMLRLAPRFFRHREPEWPSRTAAALDRAEAILDRALPAPYALYIT